VKAAALPLVACIAAAQDFTHRGFLETRFIAYPQEARNDSSRAIGEALLRYEPAYRLLPWLRLAGSFDARTDTHHQTDRAAHVDWQDRGLERPAFAVRRLTAIANRGPVTVEVGKQFIRWGKTDILNPTDRFAPRDFLSVVDNDFLAVPAVRATVEHSDNSVDLVWQARFTPSRLPLFNQRWAVLPDVPLRDLGARYPGGGAFGIRWNRIAAGYEHSVSFYEGHNHLPLFEGRLLGTIVEFRRVYPQMRVFGADAAVPLRWCNLKGETAYFTSSTAQADEYVQYVIQVERVAGEWFFVGGYAGEYIVEKRSPFEFAPDRGLARALLGRASYTIGPTRTIAAEAAVRHNFDGVWLRGEYSQTFGQHLRATLGLVWIAGSATDFLGQYRRNSHATLALRYSF
jgi:hypothetical protein